MAKCPTCNKKLKFSRNCPALNESICTKCCGTKKESEIKCVNDCKFYIEGEIKENKKQIMRLVKESFNSEYEDIYQDHMMLNMIAPFEQFLFHNYYGHKDATDEFFTDCFIKIYYTIDGKGDIYSFNELEMNIFNEFNRFAEETKTALEAQKLILLRFMKSVDNMTGGKFGNKMYLELLRNNFTGTGLVADVMGNMV